MAGVSRQSPEIVPHILTAARIRDAGDLRIVDVAEIPNPHRLRPASPIAGQRAFGDELLASQPMVLIPSVASSHS